jgi:hypothetical protein
MSHNSPKPKLFSKQVSTLRTDFYSIDLSNFRTRTFSPVQETDRKAFSRLKSPDPEVVKAKYSEVLKQRRTQVLLKELNLQLKTKEQLLPEVQVRIMSAASDDLQTVTSTVLSEGVALKSTCGSYSFEMQFIKSRVEKCQDNIEHSKLNQVKLVTPR